VSYDRPVLRRSSLAFAVAAFTVVACSSLPDLTFDDDAGSSGEGGGGEGGVDAKPDTAPSCVKTGPEICDDGIDNDCNGMADCADPACGTYACVTSAPAGWDLVAFAETAPPACPTSYTSTDLKVLNGSAAVTCPCTCTGSGGSGPTCAGATTAITTGDDAACAAAQTTANLNSNTGLAACTAIGTDLLLGSVGSTGFGKVTPPAGPLACTPAASTTKTNTTDGRACTPPTSAAAGCDATTRCLPKAPGFTMCISKTGPQTCPGGFTKTRRAGTTASDTRACTLCSCNKTACATNVTLWSNSMCNAKTSIFTAPSDTACAAPQAVSDTNYTAKFYTSTSTGGCAVGTPATPTGELTFGGERTVCCK